jgi:hypothetical protein
VGSGIRGVGKRGVEYGECDSGEWNMGSATEGSGIRGVEYGECMKVGSVKAGSGIRGD